MKQRARTSIPSYGSLVAEGLPRQVERLCLWVSELMMPAVSGLAKLWVDLLFTLQLHLKMKTQAHIFSASENTIEHAVEFYIQ